MTLVVVLSVLLAISEGLALIPQIGSNSVIQLAIQVLKGVRDAVLGAQPPAPKA